MFSLANFLEMWKLVMSNRVPTYLLFISWCYFALTRSHISHAERGGYMGRSLQSARMVMLNMLYGAHVWIRIFYQT